MHILASGPELQAVRFGYVILGENVQKGRILEGLYLAWETYVYIAKASEIV